MRRGRKTIPGQLSLLPDVAFCRTCGRQLVGAVSVERCYGPSCWKKKRAVDSGSRHLGCDQKEVQRVRGTTAERVRIESPSVSRVRMQRVQSRREEIQTAVLSILTWLASYGIEARAPETAGINRDHLGASAPCGLAGRGDLGEGADTRPG